MTLPTRSQWQSFRDGHGDSPGKGAVKSVSVGKTLDAAGRLFGTTEFKKAAKSYTKFVKDLKTYHDKIRKDHPTFAKDFKKNYLDEAENVLASHTAMAKPADALKANIVKVVKLVGALKPSSTHADYRTFFLSDPVRLVGMNLGRMATLSPKKASTITGIRNAWSNALTAQHPDSVTDDPDERWKAVTLVRKALATMTKDCQAAKLI